MEDRRKMWILGGTFIAASAMIYFLFMTAWLNFLIFVGLIIWVRIAIGLVALLAGFYNLREYFTNRAGVCKLTGTEPTPEKTDGKTQGDHARPENFAGLGRHHLAGLRGQSGGIDLFRRFSGDLFADPEPDSHALLAILSLSWFYIFSSLCWTT